MSDVETIEAMMPTGSPSLALGEGKVVYASWNRVEKRWQLGPRAYFSFVAEWMNATLSKEAVATTCTLGGCETRTIGPITIPSLGIEGGF